MFSVIIPVFNAEKTLKESLQSVLNQSLLDFEIIAINDASSDSSLKILEEFAAKDKRLRVFSLPKNAGVAIARNFGIEKAKNKYISFLDSDDLWLPHKLKKQLLAFEKGAQVTFSSYIRFDEKNTEKIVKAPRSVTYEELLFGNCIGNLTGAYDSEVLGKFFQKNIGHEDYLMWLNILKKSGRAHGIQEPLARYRVGSSSLSSNKLKAAHWVWAIYRTHLKIGFFKSCYYFFCYSIKSLRKRV